MLALLAVTACGPESYDNGSILSESQDVASYQSEIRIALAEKESESTPGAYYVAVSADLEFQPDTAKICIGTKDACQANEATFVSLSFSRQSDRFIYVTKSPIPLKDEVLLTVLATTKSGQVVTSTVKLEKAVAASECYKAPDEFVCAVEAAIARITNEYRQRNGRRPIEHDQKMSYVSRLWSAEQARTGQISHAWFSNGRWRQEYVREFGTQPRLSGENVAMNGGSASSAEVVAQKFMNQWINSSGHRANIVGNHKTIGIGVARRGNSWYATQNFGN